MHTGVGSGVHWLFVRHGVQIWPAGQTTHTPRPVSQKGVVGVPIQSDDVAHVVTAALDCATGSSGAWLEQPPNAASPNPRTPTNLRA
jgi:hypothetical protein